MSPRSLGLAVALAGCLVVARFAAAQDTVFVVQRDTVVLVQRDTLFVVERPAPAPEAPAPEAPAAEAAPARRAADTSWAPAGEIPIEELTEADIDAMRYGRDRVRARRELLKYRRAVQRGQPYVTSGYYVGPGSAYEPPPPVRTSPAAWAYHYYPSRLFDYDFPAVTLGANYVRDGRFGVTGLLGVLVDPAPLAVDGWGDDDRYGDARYGVRGFDLGAEARWLFSEPYRRNAFYLGVGASFAAAPVTFRALVPNESGTFSRIADVDAVGRRIEGTLVAGWDGRFKGGFALDLGLGFDLGGRGVFSDTPGAFDSWDDWDSIPNEYNGYLIPVIRVGLGVGRW